MPAGLQPAPFGHSGTDPRGETIPQLHGQPGPGRQGGRDRLALTMVTPMPTFDVVSEVDMQEVRNAVDQANREAGTRFDFKGTDSEIDLSDTEMVLRSSTEDRLRALHQVLEEKLVRRQVSLKALEAGKIEEAAKGSVRQKIAIQAGLSSDHAKKINKFIKDHGAKGVSSQTQGDQLRVSGKKRDRSPSRHSGVEGGGLRHPPPVHELPGLTASSGATIRASDPPRPGRHPRPDLRSRPASGRPWP